MLLMHIIYFTYNATLVKSVYTVQTGHKLNVCLFACACTHVFACYVYTRVAACCTTQLHVSAFVTQVYINQSHAVHFADTKYTGKMNSM